MMIKIQMFHFSFCPIILPLLFISNFAAIMPQKNSQDQSDQSRPMVSNRHSDPSDGGCVVAKGRWTKKCRSQFSYSGLGINSHKQCKSDCESDQMLQIMTHMALWEDECCCFAQPPDYDEIRPDYECDFNCPGDPSEICGGKDRVSVIQLNWDGACVDEDLWKFKADKSPLPLSNSPKNCKALCRSKSESNNYIALQGVNCFCLTTHPPYTSMVQRKKCECQSCKCIGDKQEFCGDDFLFNLHYSIHSTTVEEKESPSAVFLETYFFDIIVQSLMQHALGSITWLIGYKIHKEYFLPDKETADIWGLCFDAAGYVDKLTPIDMHINSEEDCKNHCTDNTANYAALQGKQCYCKMEAPGYYPEKLSCNACPDCGGATAVLVISLQGQDVGKTSCVPDVYVKVPAGQAFVKFDKNGVEPCKATCINSIEVNKPVFIGLKEAICYCSDEPPEFKKQKPEEDCQACEANDENRCGGSGTVSIYKVRGDDDEDIKSVRNTVWDPTNLLAHVYQNTWNVFWNVLGSWAYHGLKAIAKGLYAAGRSLVPMDGNKLVEDILQLVKTFQRKTKTERVAWLEKSLVQVFDQYGKQ